MSGSARRAAVTVLTCAMLAGGGWVGPAPARAAEAPLPAESYRVVDCLLPGQVRKLGRSTTFITPRRPLRTSAVNCEIRGGEYVAADRATFASSMAVWLPTAQQGDPKAQAYVGRIYAEGFDRAPDHVQAAAWYQKAADQGYAPAMIDLGQLYEQGLGVPKDPVKAVSLYRRATGLPPSDFAAAPAASGEVARLNARYEAARADADLLRRELEAARRELAEERARPAGDVAALQKALAQRTAELEAMRASAARPAPAAAPAASPALLRAAQAERDQARQQRDRLQEELAAMRGQLPVAQSRLADLELEAAQARKQAAQASARLGAALSAVESRDSELAALRARLSAEQARVSAGDAGATARLKAAQAEYDRAARDLERSRADAEALRTEIARAQDALQAREAEVAQARAAATAAEARFAKAQAELRERDERLKAAESRIAAAEGRASQAQRDFDAASRRSAELATQVAALQRDLEQAKKGQGRAASDLQAREARLAQREARIKELEARLSSAIGSYRNATPVNVSASARPTRLPASSKFGFANNYALLIGESDYRDPRIPKLATPANDVTQLGAVLQTRYGFTVKVVLDKTRAEILRELDTLAQKLGENDTLLIYYAGHGGMEKVRNGMDRGYWLPVDAEYGSTASQISNQEITYQVARMAARKVLIIADSCYSGLLTQTVTLAQRPTTAEEKTNEYLIGMAHKQSRNVLTSGRLEPVLDGGGAGNHSVFAAALIDVLKKNADVMTSEEVYSRLITRVMANATSALLKDQDVPDPQQPTYAALDNGGHVYGDFLFVPRNPV